MLLSMFSISCEPTRQCGMPPAFCPLVFLAGISPVPKATPCPIPSLEVLFCTRAHHSHCDSELVWCFPISNNCYAFVVTVQIGKITTMGWWIIWFYACARTRSPSRCLTLLGCFGGLFYRLLGFFQQCNLGNAWVRQGICWTLWPRNSNNEWSDAGVRGFTGGAHALTILEVKRLRN